MVQRHGSPQLSTDTTLSVELQTWVVAACFQQRDSKQTMAETGLMIHTQSHRRTQPTLSLGFGEMDEPEREQHSGKFSAATPEAAHNNSWRQLGRCDEREDCQIGSSTCIYEDTCDLHVTSGCVTDW